MKTQALQIYDPDGQKRVMRINQPKQVELEEDHYFEELQRIIKRDFFPEKQHGGESATVEPKSKGSLDEFLRRYTSEDNGSFAEMQGKAKEKFMEKIGWMFDENARYKKLN